MREFNFKDYELPAEIREHKDVSYTVTVIGGPKELQDWRDAQAIKRGEQQRAQREAYLLKRSFLGDIVAGRAQASSEALKAPETLGRFKWRQGLGPKPVQPSNWEVAALKEEEKPKHVLWFDKLKGIIGDVFN